MPPKDYEKSELFLGIVGDNGAIRELGRLSDVPTIDYSARAESERKSGRADFLGWEFSIDLNNVVHDNGLTSTDIFLALTCGYDIDKMKKNNWRKLHNLPMKRRGYHG